MNGAVKTIVFWLILCVSAFLLFEVVKSAPQQTSPEISYSRFMADVEAGNVVSVTITGTQILGLYRENKGSFYLTGPSNPAVFLDTLRSKGIEIRFKDAQANSTPRQLLGTWAPLIVLAVLWLYIIRRMQRRNPGPPETTPPMSGDYGRFGMPK